MILVPILFAIAFFLTAYGYRTLDPTFLDWLLSGDSAIHLLAWTFYRNSPWQFPIGGYGGQLAPFGANIINSDGNPLISGLLKLLLGPGEPIQFQGYWLLTCYILMAVFGYKLILQTTKDRWFASVASVFFVLSPVLLFRADHKALCAQWVIVCALYLYSRAQETKRYPLFGYIGLCLFAVSVHFYFVPMLLMLAMATAWLAWTFEKTLPNGIRLSLNLLLILASTFGAMFFIGYFGISKPTSTGFAFYSADLLTFFNSQNFASITPHIRFGGGQGEGFGYLGLGLVILFFTFIYFWSRRGLMPLRGLTGMIYPAGIACALLAIYSLSSNITIAGNTFIRIEWFYSLLEPLPSILRASGRFIWPLYYFLTYILLISAYAYLPKRKAISLVGVLIVIQLVDMHAWYLNRSGRVASGSEVSSLLKHSLWGTFKSSGFKNMVLVPPAIFDQDHLCGSDEFSKSEVFALSLQAVRNGMTINSAIQARPSPDQIKLQCDAFWQNAEEGSLEGKVYVAPANSTAWPRFQKATSSRAAPFNCKQLDNLKVCSISAKAVVDQL